MMLNYYQQIKKQFNVRKQKLRYKLKRERRYYLTEAFIDGELALYKPAHIPYKIFTDKIKEWRTIPAPIIEKPVEKYSEVERHVLPIELSLWQRIINWIKKTLRRQ